MEIGVIADTHDQIDAVEAAVELFRAADIEVVLHCGDIIAPPVVPSFEGFEFHAVLGNNDGEAEGLAQAIADLEMGSYLHGRRGELRIDGAEIAFLHGEDRESVDRLAEDGELDYVFYGHHHEREQRSVAGTTVVNPGAHFPMVPAEHRTVAIVDLDEDSVRFERV